MDHVQVLHSGIKRAVQRFQQNPFDFLYEVDLQALLFSFLLYDFQSEGIAMRGGFWGRESYGGSDLIRTVPVKCEYPSSHAFDIAIIDSEAIQHFDRALWQKRGWGNDRFWAQRVRAAVEIKYYQLGDSRGHRETGVQRDVDKLRQYLEKEGNRRFLGISLLFIQSDALKSEPFRVGGKEIKDDPYEGIARYVVSPTTWRKFMV